MYPNNQTPPPYQPPPQNNPYSFITDNPTPSKSPIVKGPSSMKGRIIVVAAGGLLFIIIAVIIMSLLGNAGKAQTERYVEIAKKQTEIIRISALAEEKARTIETKSLATTIRLSFVSDQAETFKMLERGGTSAKSIQKQLTAGKNAQSDELLKEAEQNNRYDETYTQLVYTELGNYKTLLQGASGGASEADVKVLDNSFKQANLITKDQATR